MRLLRLRTSLAVFALLGAACSETLAPKLERIQSQLANALTCTINWTGTAPEADNDWRNPGNWAPARLPNATDNVCITADGSFAQLFGTVNVNSITVGVPGSANPAWLAVRGTGIFTTGPEVPALLTVANGIENNGRVTMDITHRGAVRITIAGGTFENRGRFQALARNFGVDGGSVTHWFDGNVVNDGLIDFYSSVEMTGTWTNRGAVKLTQVQNNFEEPYFYNLTNGTWNQVSGSLNVAGTFEVRDGLFRFESGEIIGSEGPIVLRGAFQIAPNANNASGNVSLRQNVAMSGDVPTGLTVLVAGHAYGTTGIFVNTVVTTPSGFVNNGTMRLLGTGHVGGTAAVLVVGSNGTIINNGRIETIPGPNFQGRAINGAIDNRAGATVHLQAQTSFGVTNPVFTNSGTWNSATAFMSMPNNTTWIQNGGTMDVSAGYHHGSGGEFRLVGGTITGEPFLINTIIRIPTGSTAKGNLFTILSSLIGDVMPGQQITVAGYQPSHGMPSANGLLNVPANSTNHGTIVMSASGPLPGSTAISIAPGATLTNAADGRIEAAAGSSETGRFILGNLTNEGTMVIGTMTRHQDGTLRTSNVVSGSGELRLWGTTLATGVMDLQLRNEGDFHVGAAPGAAGAVTVKNFWMPGGGAFNANIGGSAPGVDFDRMTVTQGMSISAGTFLKVSTTTDGCADGGSSYEVITFPVRSGDWDNKVGLDLGGGRIVTTVPGTTNYLLNVGGPSCTPSDVTPPVIAATVDGTLGNNGWYTSNVSITWSVTDSESAISSQTGCDDASVTSDNAGVTFTCSATSDGGTATQSVTIKRDATPPVITTSQSPMPNANGWNNTDVTAFWSATDAMSGLEGAADRQNTFNGEGLRMNFGGRYFDKAGNVAVALIFASIDRTPPVVSASRAPLANANGWNNSDVTATYSATDALSGIAGSANATRLFNAEGAAQDGSHTFTDLAGNTAVAGVGDVNIDKTAPVVTVTRSPLPDATGWNNTDVTATWSASDALSGIDGSSIATHLFSTDGAGQSATRSFSDKAGNGASATISGINIDKTPAPPPPPPTLNPSCSVTPSEIWAPNNKMVAVRVTVGGTGVTSYSLRSVVNNESGSADVAGWTLGAADVDGFVLAKRNGGGTGRTYTLTYDVFGAGGATGSCAVTVRVPHDQRR